jgi:hypothetical protein
MWQIAKTDLNLKYPSPLLLVPNSATPGTPVVKTKTDTYSRTENSACLLQKTKSVTQDGALPHFHLDMQDFWNTSFSNFVAFMGFFVWGLIKNHIY